MSKQIKPTSKKGILFDAQYEMCDVVYRKLYELMISVKQCEVLIELNSVGTFRMNLYESDSCAVLCHVSKTTKNTLGYLYFNRKFSSTEIEDPFIKDFLLKKNEYNDSRPEIYARWFEKLKEVMQKLLDEQEKYKEISYGIQNIPMFSPTREVLIEKKK